MRSVRLSPILLVAMETSWLTVWSILLGGWLGLPGSPLLPAPAIGALVGGGWLLTRAALNRRWPPGLVRLVVGGAAVLTALLAVRVGPLAGGGPADLGWIGALVSALPTTFQHVQPAIAALVFALYLCWRGLRRARHRLDALDVEGAFRWGALGLATGLILRAATLGSGLADVSWAASGFLLAGLIAVAVAQVEAAQAQLGGRGSGVFTVNRYWLGLLVALVGLILISAGLLAQALSFDLLDALVRPVVAALQLLALAVVIVLAIPAGLLLEVLAGIVRLVRGGAAPVELPHLDTTAFDAWRQTTTGAAPPPELVLIVKWAILGLAGVALIALLVRSIARLGDLAPAAGVEEERDLVWSWPDLGVLLDRWRIRRSAGKRPSSADRDLLPAARAIRAIYRELLEIGAALGRPRQASQTPAEYAAVLRSRLPMASEAIGTLTSLYSRVRYGPPPFDDAAIGLAERAIARVKAAAPAGHPDPARSDRDRQDGSWPGG